MHPPSKCSFTLRVNIYVARGLPDRPVNHLLDTRVSSPPSHTTPSVRAVLVNNRHLSHLRHRCRSAHHPRQLVVTSTNPFFSFQTERHRKLIHFHTYRSINTPPPPRHRNPAASSTSSSLTSANSTCKSIRVRRRHTTLPSMLIDSPATLYPLMSLIRR